MSYDQHTERLMAFKAQEESCVFSKFDGDVAWELGTIVRTMCQQASTHPAAIYIAHANSEQPLFFAVSRPGTLPDDMDWAKRKGAVAAKLTMSSLRVGMMVGYGRDHTHIEERAKYDYKKADSSAMFGGGFPIRVKNVEGTVGVIAVHGLGGDIDHKVIVDGIQKYLARDKQE